MRKQKNPKKIGDIEWYVDLNARGKNKPGIYHSYMSSLATVLNHINGELDPVWLMGSSGFAFRIFVNEVFCPSAMSIFDWQKILPEAIEQMGYHCIYVSRGWNESEREKERRDKAGAAIIEGIENGVPAVVWDIADCEWGVIIGYDLDDQSYDTLTWQGKPSTLTFDKLGKNGIDVLSVAIPGEPNHRSREEIILNSLNAAVAHAEQKEWNKRPQYQDGFPAFDLWALLFDRWVLLLKAGKGDKISTDIPDHAAYYAGHFYSARCYASDYLNAAANGNDYLKKAASSYEKAACFIKPVWDYFSKERKPDESLFSSFAQSIRNAKAAEEEGINSIKEYLVQPCV